MIPSIRFDFNFDFILVMLFASYILYGYLSGGHKQIRISINLILPFTLLYFLGRTITVYLYTPLSKTFLFEMVNDYFGILKNTIGMVFAYGLMVFCLLAAIFFLAIYARKYILNENMRAKLGQVNNILGAIFGVVNGYVLIYFIVLPVFSLNLIDAEARMSTWVLENPPPFSRIARTAEKAVPVKNMTDKADTFQRLLSAEGIAGYYNDAIYDYQQEYMGGSDSKEAQFMETVYPELSTAGKQELIDAYDDYFGEVLSETNYLGISRVLVEETASDSTVYEDVLAIEKQERQTLRDNLDVIADFETELAQYEIDLENYEFQLVYDVYLDLLETYLDDYETYITNKITSIAAGTPDTSSFSSTRPVLTTAFPDNYEEISTTSPPENPEDSISSAVADALAYVEEHRDHKDVTDEFEAFADDFMDHKGLLMWYVDELDRNMATSAEGGNISDVIYSYKNYYDTIADNINDDELASKLYVAQMSIRSYDVFTLWLDCTQDNIANVALDDIQLEENRCLDVDPANVTSYDFTEDALSIIKTLFEGESVSWIILQFKFDYEAGVFDDHFDGFTAVTDVLVLTKDLVDKYDLFYKDIANSIEGNISMVFKIGISVMKFHLDVYNTLDNTPLISAFFNDAARFCSSPAPSPINRDVTICPQTEGEGAFAKEFFNMRYLSSEVLFKAYLTIDENNEQIIYDSEKMRDFLAKANKAVEDQVLTAEVISMFADQLAFNVIDETTNYTLLEQMYDDGQISIEAMRILADDEYGLFSLEFRTRVRSLIR